MSEVEETTENLTEAATSSGLKLQGLFAYKEGMSTIYNDLGEAVPVTVLRYEPCFVSQLKTKEKDGYSAVQISCVSNRKKKNDKAILGHLKKAGLESTKLTREIRQAATDGLTLGAAVSIESLAKGDKVKITAKSKGHGFQGSVRRWGFAGGPASHGSKFHRQPGSSGNRTWPGRVMPGKKFPGHWGDESVTVKNVEIVDVIAGESVVLVRGPIPGGRNTLVKLVRE